MRTDEVDAVFRVIPAVDVLGKEAVRLVRGAYDDVALREPDPLGLIRRVVAAGADLVHVVDLTGARSGETRPELFRQAVEAAGPARVQASGGIRSVDDAERLVDTGVERVVVGTAAFTDGDVLERLAERLGERLVVALDVRDGHVRVRGWEEASAFTVDAATERCRAAGVRRLLCTAIDRDGTLSGPALDLLEHVVRTSELAVLAAGGISSPSDIRAVEALGCEAAIVGRALLEGRVPLAALAVRD